VFVHIFDNCQTLVNKLQKLVMHVIDDCFDLLAYDVALVTHEEEEHNP
jgi:hypothetical protein